MLTSVSNVDVQGHPLLTSAELQSRSGIYNDVRDEEGKRYGESQNKRRKEEKRRKEAEEAMMIMMKYTGLH